MGNLSIINTLQNRVADIYIKLKSIVYKTKALKKNSERVIFG